MTSSADPRRTATRPAGARRVAGSRRGARTPWATAPESTVQTRESSRSETRDGVPRTDPPVATPASATEPAHAASAAPSEVVPRECRVWPAATAAGLALGLLTATLVIALRPALSDADRSAAVGSARTTLESLLSYSGASFDAHVAQVTPQLAAPFRDQFAKVAAADIEPMAVENGATVQAKVFEAGVMDASGLGGEGTTVRVLAFVNQATTTKAKPGPTIDQNRVVATMRKVGERWLLSDLSAF